MSLETKSNVTTSVNGGRTVHVKCFSPELCLCLPKLCIRLYRNGKLNLNVQTDMNDKLSKLEYQYAELELHVLSLTKITGLFIISVIIWRCGL